jgi:hypothetical protein
MESNKDREHLGQVREIAEVANDFVNDTSAGASDSMSFIHFIYTVVVKALCYKPEGRGFQTRWGDFFNLPNPSGRTRPWGLLSL